MVNNYYEYDQNQDALGSADDRMADAKAASDARVADRDAAQAVRDAVETLNGAIRKARQRGLQVSIDYHSFTEIPIRSVNVYEAKVFRITEIGP